MVTRFGGFVALAILAAGSLTTGPQHLADAQELSSVESSYLSGIRQVTDGFVKAGEGYFSPDGKQIIYQAVRQEYPFYQIYTQPLKGGTPRLISTGRGRTTCSYFSPDGNSFESIIAEFILCQLADVWCFRMDVL